MITSDNALRTKVKMERIAFIKERHYRLILRQRQEVEGELQHEFEYEEDFVAEVG